MKVRVAFPQLKLWICDKCNVKYTDEELKEILG